MTSNNDMCVHVVDYTSSGTIVSGTAGDIKMASDPYNNVPYIHGLEFNTDGSKLYISHQANTIFTHYVDYVPTTSMGGTTVTTLTSISGVPAIPNLQYSQIELNYQGSTPYLYLADSTNLISYNMSTTWNSSAVTFPTPQYNIGDMTWFLSNYSINMTSFLLPDQIDGGYYNGSSGAPAACCLFYNSYDRVQYSAGAQSGWTSSTQTWSQNTTAGTYQNNPLTLTTSDTVTIGEELRIPAGFIITINNMKIKFSPQARLIIEGGKTTGTHGGQLILSGCTLTVDNRCGIDMWPGVQVWGSPTHLELQTKSGQKQFSLKPHFLSYY
jgi:hypothetical protein